MRIKSAEDLPKASRQRQQLEAALKDQQAAEQAMKDDGLASKSVHRNQPEQELQRELIRTAKDWSMQLLLGNAWPAEIRQTPLIHWLYHTPNGGYRSAAEAGIFKALGVMPGVWDLFLMFPTNKYPGLYQELKVGDNDLTDNQEKFRTRAQLIGYRCDEIRSGIEFFASIENYFLAAEPYQWERM